MAKTKTVAANHKNRERAAFNRAQEAEKLRGKLKGGIYLGNIHRSVTELGSLQTKVKASKNTKTNKDAVTQTIQKCKAQADIIKIKLDANFKLLAKLLPDLKAFEHTDPDGNNPFASFVETMAQATKDAGK